MAIQRKKRYQMTRRDFLRMSAIGAGAAALAACAPNVAALPTQAPTTAPAATEVQTVAATAVPATAAPQATTITWESWGGTDRFTPLIQAWAKTFPDTAKWLSIKVISGGQNDVEMYKQFRTALSAGGEGLPDFFESNVDAVPEFATRGLMADLSDKMKPYLADLIPGALKVASFGDKVVAVPTQVKSKVWYYRKDLFQAAGIDPAQIKTMDDLIAAGTTFHAKNADSFLINLGPQPIHYWYGEILSTWDDVRF